MIARRMCILWRGARCARRRGVVGGGRRRRGRWGGGGWGGIGLGDEGGLMKGGAAGLSCGTTVAEHGGCGYGDVGKTCLALWIVPVSIAI